VRPERIIAALLAALAAGLVAILVLGPTEGAEATAEPPGATTEPATTVPETVPTQTSPPATSTVDVEPPVTTEPEPEPAEPLRPLPGDGTFPGPVRMTLTGGEGDEETARLEARVRRVRIGARATALKGEAGDNHGLECGTARLMYSVTVDPWGGFYSIIRWDATRSSGLEIESGSAYDLARPPAPNVISLTCVARAEGARIALSANGRGITSMDDRVPAGRFTDVGVEAYSPLGGEDVVFDGVVVDTG